LRITLAASFGLFVAFAVINVAALAGRDVIAPLCALWAALMVLAFALGFQGFGYAGRGWENFTIRGQLRWRWTLYVCGLPKAYRYVLYAIWAYAAVCLTALVFYYAAHASVKARTDPNSTVSRSAAGIATEQRWVVYALSGYALAGCAAPALLFLARKETVADHVDVA
jgi:hypothetical protein